MSIANQRLTELKTGMLLYTPFFASLLFDQMEIEVGKFPHLFGSIKGTAATDGRRMWIDEDFLAGLKLPEAVFLVCHEIGHAMWKHMERGKNYQDIGLHGKPFDPRLFNVAADYVINDMLIQSGVGDMPKGGLHRKDITHDMLVEDVYKKLMDEQEQQKQNGKGQGDGLGGNGKPDANGNDGSTLDVHIHAPSPVTEAEMKRAVQSAVNAAKAMGKLPGALERFAEKLLNPQVPWQEKLRTVIMRTTGRDGHSWHAPHKRRLALQGIIMPRSVGFGAGEIVVAVDTSGSIGQHELNTFFGELAGILDDAKPEKIWVLGVDAAVNSVEEFDQGWDVQANPPKPIGGGGTSFIPAFDWVDEQCLRPAALIYFTDMYGSFPQGDPGYPVIWAATTPTEGPFGETVHIKVSHE